MKNLTNGLKNAAISAINSAINSGNIVYVRKDGVTFRYRGGKFRAYFADDNETQIRVFKFPEFSTDLYMHEFGEPFNL